MVDKNQSSGSVVAWRGRTLPNGKRWRDWSAWPELIGGMFLVLAMLTFFVALSLAVVGIVALIIGSEPHIIILCFGAIGLCFAFIFMAMLWLVPLKFCEWMSKKCDRAERKLSRDGCCVCCAYPKVSGQPLCPECGNLILD